MEFTKTERAILRLVQRDLPDSLTPFADIAEAAGTDEASVLALLRRMKDQGAIRRFGASVKHQKAGFTHNAMVAWIIDPERMDEAGEAAAANDNVSHCYYRPSPVEDWPYTLYTMVHGRSEEECRAVVEALASLPPMGEHAVLPSLKELKKISMTYF
ncbi:MAG: winged helix-turn-helix transcriptional regulator [Deltaproteobacteria bacterium]|nr:winged helix-turn-helix transcriptional regulator [Deltaproteobacteria bacterium]